MAKRYGTDKLPETYLVVRGEVVKKFVGQTDWDDPALRELITARLEEPGARPGRPDRERAREIAVKIGLAALLAGAVGAEREWTGQWAGLAHPHADRRGRRPADPRLDHLRLPLPGGSNAWDPCRIAAEIVSGIGFLGAGTIIQSRGAVHGLTTAAGLWVASAIGIAVGARYYEEAAVTSVALLLILAALRPLERRLLSRKKKSSSRRRGSRLRSGSRYRRGPCEELGLVQVRVVARQLDQHAQRTA